MKKVRMCLLLLMAILLCSVSVHAENLPDFEQVMLDNRIPYDHETQKLVVIDVQSAPVESTELWDITQEELASLKSYMKKEKKYSLCAFINDMEMEYGSSYYIYNAKEDTLRNERYSYEISATDEDEYIILMLNKDDTARVTFSDHILDGRPGYTSSLEGGKYHGLNGALIYRPAGEADRKGYSVEGTAPVTLITYNYTWLLGVELEFEWFYYDPELQYSKWDDTWYKYVDMPGLGFDIYEDVAFRIELRDKGGNIFPLPEGTMYTDGMYKDFLFSDADGVLYDYADPERSLGYGECYTYIPVGYDYRVFIDSNGDALGILGYIYSWVNGTPFDKDGFQGWDFRNWDGSFDEYRTIQFNFFPKSDIIRVEKKVEEKVNDNTDYVFRATRDDIRFSNEYYFNNRDEALFETTVSYPLKYYPYTIYDAVTNEKIEQSTELKTDKEGKFTLKAGQYALFEVWELPEDFLSYVGGCNTIGDEITPEELAKAPHASTYTFEELFGGSNYSTSIFHNTDEVEGKLVEDVQNGDTVLIVNKYSEKTGSIEISNMVSGNAADFMKPFSYVVTLSDKNITGKYGDVEFKNGVSAIFGLRHGEKRSITDLPVGIGFMVTESEYDEYTVTANGVENKVVAEGIVSYEETIIPFVNVLNKDSADGLAGGDDVPKTGDGSPLMLWFLMLMVSSFALVLFRFSKVHGRISGHR